VRPPYLQLLFVLAVVAAIAAACSSGSSTPPDLSSARDTLPVYPGAAVVREGVRPNSVAEGSNSVFAYDRLYVIGGTPQQDEMLDKMTELLAQAGWQQESTTTSHSKGIRYYCSLGYVKCASLVKDGVRVVVSVPLPLNFNPQAGEGANYHTHLEKK